MNQLIVPVYLNQRMVFDQIAMLKKGISTVTTITHSESDSKSNQSEVSSEVGATGILSSLLRVNLSGSLTSGGGQQSGTEASENRVHTPASLFYELRNQLNQEKLLLTLNSEIPTPGNFVEFECQLNRNPLLESLETVMEIGNLTKEFSKSSISKAQQAKQKGNRNRNQNQGQQDQISDIDNVMEVVKLLTEKLADGKTSDLVGMNINNSFSAVITLEVGSLNDPQMSDLVDGQFKVLGVVVKSIRDDSDSISLIRKTTFSKLPSAFLDPILTGLGEFSATLEMDSSPLSLSIQGPAIQVLPVAIFA